MTLRGNVPSKIADSEIHIAAVFGSLSTEGEILRSGLAHQSQCRRSVTGISVRAKCVPAFTTIQSVFYKTASITKPNI